jgi:glutamate--cysteine ligase
MRDITTKLHEKILNHESELNSWFLAKSKDLKFPIYSSFDIRDGGYKVAPVDANLYPAGFNNICAADKEFASEKLGEFLNRVEPDVKCIGLLTENHTGNKYYWDNVYTIRELIENAGFNVGVSLTQLESDINEVETASGRVVVVDSFKELNAKVDLWISNNDFSVIDEDLVSQITVKVVPSYKFGWMHRKKIRFFEIYNALVSEVAKIIDVPVGCLDVATMSYDGFDIESEESKELLYTKATPFYSDLVSKMADMGIEAKPNLFLKNNSGTYGLGVMAVSNPEDIRSMSYKQRKKMKATKGGGGVTSVILQEGIPTITRDEDSTAEPVLYMIGPHRIGGFLRTHKKKGPSESLNSPGAVFKKLCISDLHVRKNEIPQENVYGWVAKIGTLACAIELKEMEASN